jgi:glycosyltransferase involved in cell wall biosynthesis
MRLFIESSAIIAERSGIGAFTKRLIEAYHKEFPEQKIKLFGFRLFYRKFTPPIPKTDSLNYRLIRWFPGKIYTGLFKNGVPLPIDAFIGASRKDVILFPNFVRWPLVLNKRSVAIIHDLSFVFYGQYSSGPNKDYMLKFVPKTIKKANHLITISECSKKDMCEYYGIALDRVSIVNPFIDMSLFKRTSSSEIARVKHKLKLPKKYLLYMSTVEPRKNVIGLLEAYQKLPKKVLEEYGLVLAGGKGWLNDEIHAEADRLVDQGLNIVRTGYIADEDLAALYSGATLYVFIPHYEGFGISPLEAMACGIPVITSNNSSLPEVVGKAGLLVNAAKPLETTKAIEKLLNSPALCKRMVKEGYSQAAKFSASRSAKQLQSAIDKVSS